MATRYEYQSNCCNKSYMETRNEEDPMIYPTCVQCGQGQYVLITETKLEDLSQPQEVPTETDESIPLE
jgi:hypothetical protein